MLRTVTENITSENAYAPEKRDALTFVAPARVNLIGEHTDYTGGLVLPIAVPFSTQAALLTADDGMYHFTSDRFVAERTLPPDDRSAAAGDWSDYPVGVLRELQKLGHTLQPFRLAFTGDVPLASGLSSSASIEVATAFALLHHLGATMAPEAIAQLCQRAENLYVNSPCGIMDQTVSVLAQAGHALLLNTRTLDYEMVPMNRGGLAETSLVVCNSTVKHSVAAGEYGQRRLELEAGQAVLVEVHPHLRDLGDATMAELETVRDRMSPASFKRCRHIVTENARVREMREALMAGDAARAGELMTAAHASERDDFECSCEEIDFLVEVAIRQPGCFGGRLTGGGFGGCTVNLVQKASVEAFTATLVEAYAAQFGIKAEVYVCEPVDGAFRRNPVLAGHARGEVSL